MRTEKEIRKMLDDLYLEKEILVKTARTKNARGYKASIVFKAMSDLKEVNKLIKIFEWILKEE